MPCPSGSGVCRYDADISDHVHVAMRDGRLVDLPQDLSSRLIEHIPDELLDELERRMGVRVGSLNIQVLAEARSGARHHPAD
jgi:hypothetical protein